MKNGPKSNWNRRGFLKTIGLATLGIGVLQSCIDTVAKLMIKLSGTNHILGHKLRFNDFPEPSQTIEIPYLVVGAGISGLSAAREFSKNNISNFLVLELETKIGGNSASSKNNFSEFPLGAHYLPVPNKSDTQLLDFLAECDIVYKTKDAYAVNPDHLCYAPQERLFINNHWQEGIVPDYGMSNTYFEQLKRFEELMLFYRNGKDESGKFWFDIPVKNSSKDSEIIKLDKITFKNWLASNSINDPDLLSYLNYCCRDDFGLGINYVSAWAGIHYFTARKHDLTDGNEKVFTWPEGNGRLVKHLEKYVEDKVRFQNLVYKIEETSTGANVYSFDEKAQKSTLYKVKKVILCTPQYVNQYILKDRKDVTKAFNYAPWMLATLTVSKFNLGEGAPLSWDNVLHKGNGLGYIFNQNQSVEQYKSPFVITYYYSFNSDNLKQQRKLLYEKDENYWSDFVIKDLTRAHYKFEENIQEIEIHKIGHGMISPTPNFIFSDTLKQAKKPINTTIYFAHSDLSGISIFEEAFHQGIDAVKLCLNHAKLDT